jgi:YbbR domain-containing protein
MTKAGIGLRLWQALTENLWLKVIALVFSLGFYAFIHSAENAQRTVPVKLVAEKPPDTVNRRLMTDIPPTVDVTLVGPFQQLEQIEPDDLSISLNLQGGEDIPELKLLPEMVNGLPPRVRATRVQPSKLRIRFEAVVSRELAVQVPRTGEPAEGMEVAGKPLVEPHHVVATGGESAVSTLQSAPAEAFDVTGLSDGKHKRRLTLMDAPEGVSWDIDSVDVTIEVRRRLATREFSDIPVEVVGVVTARTRPAAVDIKIQGPPELVEALREVAIVPRVEPRKAGVDLSQPGSADLAVIVDIPSVHVTVTPPTVFVKW